MPGKRRVSRGGGRATRRRMDVQNNLNFAPVTSVKNTATMTDQCPNFIETTTNIVQHTNSPIYQSPVLPNNMTNTYTVPSISAAMYDPSITDSVTSYQSPVMPPPGTVPFVSAATYEPPTGYYAVPQTGQIPSHTFMTQQQDQYLHLQQMGPYPSQHLQQMGPHPSQVYAPENQNLPVAQSATPTLDRIRLDTDIHTRNISQKIH